MFTMTEAINCAAQCYSVSPSVLLEDEGFVKLALSLKKKGESWAVCIEILTSYIQDNY